MNSLILNVGTYPKKSAKTRGWSFNLPALSLGIEASLENINGHLNKSIKRKPISVHRQPASIAKVPLPMLFFSELSDIATI